MIYIHLPPQPASIQIQVQANNGIMFVPSQPVPIPFESLPSLPKSKLNNTLDTESNSNPDLVPNQGLSWDQFQSNTQSSKPSSNTTSKKYGSNLTVVMPVDIDQSGEFVWGKASDWSKAWVVPFKSDGMRIIAITGDAEDKEKIPANILSDFTSAKLSQALKSIAVKYSASNVAIVSRNLNNDNTISVWLWKNGNDPVSLDVAGANSIQQAKTNSLNGLLVLLNKKSVDSLDSDNASINAPPEYAINSTMNSNTDNSNVANQVLNFHNAPESLRTTKLNITQRKNGGLYFILLIQGTEPDLLKDVQKVLSSINQLSVVTISRNETNDVEVQGVWKSDIQSLIDLLNDRGLPMIPDL